MSPFPLSRRVARALLLAAGSTAVAGLCAGAHAPASAAIGPGVKEVVEFTRIIQPHNQDNDELQSQVSPDGRHAFIVTRRADVRTDRNRFEILLLDVSPQSLAARRDAAPTRLLAIDSKEDFDYANPSIQDVRWAGNGTLVLRARVHDAPAQVYRLDVATRRLAQLTFEPRGVVSFASSSDLRRVVYAVQVPHPALPPGARSIVVANQSFWSVKHGLNDLRAQQRRYRYYAVRSGSRATPRALGEDFAEAGGSVPGVSVSPDGRWALLHRYEPERQLEWARRYPLVADAIARFGPAVTIDPLRYFSRPGGYLARRLVAYRLSDGKEQAVLDAPDDALPGGPQLRADRLWQGRGESVVIAGTFLPREAGEGQAASSASHIVEYWPDGGRWAVIARLKGRLEAVRPLPGGHGFLAIDEGQRRRFVRSTDGGWRELGDADAPETDPMSGHGASDAAWALRIEQSLNQPPDVVASRPGGESVRLTRLNPHYSVGTWGSMRPYAWTDAHGRLWEGGLMLPAGFDPKVRHALVMQAYGFSPTRFYLDGANRADGFTSGFAGRAFLREDILVLALPWRASRGAPDDEPGAITAFADAVQSAAEALVKEGLVGRERIGVMGWSATGERVLDLVTFSDAPVRAASMVDGDANTLFSMTITYGFNDGTQARKEKTNQGGPFGESLERWVRNDPSLHTDCIRAALRIESYGPWVLNNWDIYALMRRQYKPVEMIVIPGGTHALSRPSERMISLQGNVDWFRFWLKGEERTEPFLLAETDAGLRQQYVRWRQMAELKRADDARPRCARRRGVQ